MNPRTDLWLQNLVDERDGAALYDGLAHHEKDAARAASFRELAEAERRHAEIWLRKLEKEGVAVPPDRPSPRVRALVWLARRLGTAAVVPMVLDTEAGDAEKYDAQGGEAKEIADEERAHRRALVGMSRGAPTEAREIIACDHRPGAQCILGWLHRFVPRPRWASVGSCMESGLGTYRLDRGTLMRSKHGEYQ